MLGNTGGYNVPYDSLISPSSLPAKWGNGPSYYGLAAFTGGACGHASKLRGRGRPCSQQQEEGLAEEGLVAKAEQHPQQEKNLADGGAETPPSECQQQEEGLADEGLVAES